jgi:hypothetical protein
MTPVRLAAITIDAPCTPWGGGFFLGRDAQQARVVVQRAFAGEAPALRSEGAWRRAHPHANMPVCIDDGSEAAEGPHADAHAWLVYAAVPSVRVDRAIGVYAVPVVLAWAMDLVDVMRHHARVAAETGHETALSPRFSDLLFTSGGALLVLTVPSPVHRWQSDHLRQWRLDWEMRAPELRHKAQAPFGARADVFAVGGFVRSMLREPTDEPRRDISARTALLVQRALGPQDGRHESLDELAHDLRACMDEFPPLDAAERARAVRAVAGEVLAEREKELAA